MKKNIFYIFILIVFISSFHSVKAHDSLNRNDRKEKKNLGIYRIKDTNTTQANKLIQADIENIKKEISKIKKDNDFNAIINNSLQVILMVIQLLIFSYGIIQFRDLLKFNRREKIYNGFNELERDIDDNNKDIWGLPEDNKMTVDGISKEINLKKISYMVRLIDIYSFERGHSKRYRYNTLSKENVLYQMFSNPQYIEYWEHLVKKCFYGESRFSKVIDATIAEIRRKKELEDIELEESHKKSV